MRVDKDGWLEAEAGDPPIERIPSKQSYDLVTPKPVGVVWHWAASGRGGVGVVRNLAREIADDKPEPRSWHVMVARGGEVVQSIPFTKGAWHVGKPADLDGPGPAPTVNVNRDTIGIEMDCAGRLHKVGDKLLAWPWEKGSADLSDRGQLVKQVAPWLDGYYDTYTPEQEATAARLVRALHDAYGLPAEMFRFGHVNFDFPRKEDPGPIWMNEVLPRVLAQAIAPPVPVATS